MLWFSEWEQTENSFYLKPHLLLSFKCNVKAAFASITLRKADCCFHVACFSISAHSLHEKLKPILCFCYVLVDFRATVMHFMYSEKLIRASRGKLIVVPQRKVKTVSSFLHLGQKINRNQINLKKMTKWLILPYGTIHATDGDGMSFNTKQTFFTSALHDSWRKLQLSCNASCEGAVPGSYSHHCGGKQALQYLNRASQECWDQFWSSWESAAAPLPLPHITFQYWPSVRWHQSNDSHQAYAPLCVWEG